MLLSILLKEIFQVPAESDREILQLALDSRQVGGKSLFLAVKGAQLDGRKFISGAISQGAAAVLVDADSANEPMRWQENVPIIPVYQLQKHAGELAARFYGYPAKTMRMIGVTGTSGKTSCTHFIAQSLQMLQLPCGIIGTLGSGFYGALGAAGLTTPDAVTLQATLHQFAEQGARAIAMEVSSHSIDQGRINGIEFDIGIFTNLSQDHLDYHGDMETYAAVKRRFLAELPTRHVIINADDVYGNKWINELSPHKTVIAYAMQKPSSLSGRIPLIYADRIELTLQGIRAQVITPWGMGDLFLPLIGKFNLSNGLAVLAALCTYGISLPDALHCLSRLNSVPGRMQTLGGRDRPLVVVDYAHKPDALEKVLQALRAHAEGKLYCVFGCGGERDRGKRPMMARIAEQLADRVIVTNDNPRHEDPQAIISEIIKGFSHPERVSIELDRSKAIKNSIQWASVKDCVLIAGKGAERYQQIGDEKIPFDDVEKVREYLA
jgi:UDP-N-acetylmuramoyl-L-alanyl-D-glutamate--2,6-diaminopimelate ligase